MQQIDITRRTYSIYEKVFKENGFKLTPTNDGVKFSPLGRQPQHFRFFNTLGIPLYKTNPYALLRVDA